MKIIINELNNFFFLQKMAIFKDFPASYENPNLKLVIERVGGAGWGYLARTIELAIETVFLVL